MKKLLLSLAAAVGLVFTANATDVNITFSSLGYSNGTAVTTVNTGDSKVTMSCDKGNGSNAPAYYTSGTALRVYANNEVTISVASGYEITGITMTNVNNYAFKGTINGEAVAPAGVSSWSGKAQSLKLVNTSTSQWRVQKLTITYESSAPKDVEDVQIESVEKDGVATVTLSCATEGATIKYGFTENAMTNTYSAPFTVSEKCTVYAYAEKDGKIGSTSSLAIELPAVYTNLKDLVANAAEDENITVNGNFAVLYQNGNYLLITDGLNNALVYRYGETLAPGTKISSISGTVTLYGQLMEIENATLTEGGNGATYNVVNVSDPSTLTIENNLFDEVVFKGSDISGVSGKNATLTLNGKTIALYNTFGIEFDNGENFDVTGFVWRYNNNLQIAPVSIVGGTIIPTIDDPVFNPASSELTAGDLITITCATEGVNIYYTTDGSEPTESSTLYTAPIEFTEAVTIKARAFSADAAVEMIPSAIVSAVYTVFDPNKPVETEVTFDFSNCNGITWSDGSDVVVPSADGTDITSPLLKDNVTISFAGTGTTPRIWNTGQLRPYKGNEMTIAAPDKYIIKKIEFTYSKGTLELAENQAGTYTDKVWSPNNGEEALSVMFNVTVNAQITKINVYLDQNTETAVTEIGVAEGEAEYYTLSGVKVANPTNGIYVKVLNGKATKVVIR